MDLIKCIPVGIQTPVSFGSICNNSEEPFIPSLHLPVRQAMAAIAIWALVTIPNPIFLPPYGCSLKSTPLNKPSTCNSHLQSV